MLTDQSTISDLANLFNELGATIRIRTQWTRSGTRFITWVPYPGGTAMFSNMSLGRVLDASLKFMSLHPVQEETGNGNAVAAGEIVAPDPNGARVGPAPRPDPTGTRVGHVLTPVHCAVCGFGEEERETYRTGEACPSCGVAGRSCPMEPGHEGNHDLREDGVVEESQVAD